MNGPQDDDRYILSHWEKPVMHPEFQVFPILKDGGGEYQQWHIITSKGHPFLRKIIKRIINNILNYNILRNKTGRGGVVRLTGPIPYTLEIEKIRLQHPHRIVNVHQDFGIIYNIFELYVGDRSHEKIFKGKHYSKLITPIVLPETFRDYFWIFIFYFSQGPKLLKKKIKSEFPILYSKLHP